MDEKVRRWRPHAGSDEKRGRRYAKPWAVCLLIAVELGVGSYAAGRPSDPVLHEPLAPNPGEDFAMHAALDGDPRTPSQPPGGPVAAPDSLEIPSPADGAGGTAAAQEQFRPDRDTRRPEVNGYADPFTPATAPFKRLAAYDGVDDQYTLYVHDQRRAPLPVGSARLPDEDQFFFDAVIDLAPDRDVRLPSVGPEARILRARLGRGADDIAFRVLHDGADNWYLRSSGMTRPIRARVVMELSIARATFGGPIADPSWTDLLPVPKLPINVQHDAALVASAIGVSRAMRPRQVVAALVDYFRSFSDSDEALASRGNVYFDLALSKKGVCRHRAFAFLVTALGLGIPTRMLINEAHAWVEIHDGSLWRRIDLGGAGRLNASLATGDEARYQPPSDAFGWPSGSRSGDEMVVAARLQGAAAMADAGRISNVGAALGPWQGEPGAQSSEATANEAQAPREPWVPSTDERPRASVTLIVVDGGARRGAALRMRGRVDAHGESCGHVAVDILLRSSAAARPLFLGTLATGDDGSFNGAIVIPESIALGDYEVIGRTTGDAWCGAGSN